MSKIGIVSIGSAGTMGHMSLTTNLAKALSENGHEVHLISEYDCMKFSNVKKEGFKLHKLPKQAHTKSAGGSFDYKHYKELTNYIEKEELSAIIFSTFFDLRVLDFCKKNKINTILVSYPLRDSHRGLIKIRGYYNKFDKVFTLNDITRIETVSKNEEVVSPLSFTIKEITDSASQIKKILITCGGGGRPSSKKFFRFVEKAIKKLNKINATFKFLIISGNSRIKIDEKNCENVFWSNDFHNLLKDHDLIISEAGYFTLIDLLSMKKPAILIPGERRVDNQEMRALKYQEAGCGYAFLPEEDPNEMARAITYLMSNKEVLKEMSVNAVKLRNQLMSPEKLDAKILEFLK